MWKVNGPGSCWYIRLMWWIIGLHFGFRGPAEPTRDRKWAIMRAEWKLIICKIWNSLGNLTLWSLILKFNSFRIIFFFKILIQQWVRVRWREFFFFLFLGEFECDSRCEEVGWIIRRWFESPEMSIQGKRLAIYIYIKSLFCLLLCLGQAPFAGKGLILNVDTPWHDFAT